MPSRVATVDRKIYFYRAHAGILEDGSPKPFDCRPILEHIAGLPYKPDGNYWDTGDGNYTVCFVDRKEPAQRIRLGTSRRRALPHVEESGRTSPLGIAAAAGLLEQVHIVFFPDNIVGAEFNFYGPRMSRLRGYFRVKANGTCPDVDFEQLLRQDVAEKMLRMRGMKLFQFGIRRSYLDVLRDADSDLASAFDAQFGASEADQAEVILRVRPYDRRGALADRMFQKAQRILRMEGLREHATKFVIKATNEETGRVEPLDLLNDQLIASRTVIKDGARSRAVDSESAFTAVESAYNELREDIAAAASVTR